MQMASTRNTMSMATTTSGRARGVSLSPFAAGDARTRARARTRAVRVLGALALAALPGLGAVASALGNSRFQGSSPLAHGVTEASAVVDGLALDEVLAAAREAAGRDSWKELPHGLRLTGTTDAGGVDASFELFLAADGRYRYALEGRLGRLVTFDGSEVAQRVRRGPSVALELGDREGWHFAQWIHSGYWLDAACPLEIALEVETAEEVTLRLVFPDSPAPGLLVLDRATWLPKELRQRALGADSVLRFERFEALAGVTLARRVVSESHGQSTALVVGVAERAESDGGGRYRSDEAPASDVRFDPERGPQLELKRVRSGHLLVHPRVEGQDVGWFILDSGAGQICIDPKAADALELEEFGSVPAVGVAGAVSASYRQGSRLELGPLTLLDPVYVEIELSFLEPVFGVEIAGICGYEIFSRAIVDLDLEAETLALHDPAIFRLPEELGEDIWAPLILDGRIPSVRCRFEGDREGLFKLDLGDAGTISFYSPAVRELGLLEGRAVEASQVGGVGGTGKASVGDLEWFEVGGHRVAPLRATFSLTETGAFSNARALGNLGTGMLRPFRVVFDYSRSRLALVPRK